MIIYITLDFSYIGPTSDNDGQLATVAGTNRYGMPVPVSFRNSAPALLCHGIRP